MKLKSSKLHNFLIILSLTLALPALRAAAQTKPDSAAASPSAAIAAPVPARITQAIDETQLVRLKGNVHPLARAEFDQGAVSDAQPMKRMMLLLQRSPEQQAALQQLMLEQQTKDSPNFHKWLTPSQFGAQFGPADGDIQTVTDWLTRQGFNGIRVANGKTVIEFSGNAAQVRSAFHTDIHKFLVNSEPRSANVADPQIPAAMTPVVKGIVSLHNFPRRSLRHDTGIHKALRNAQGGPQFTTSPDCGPNQSQPCFIVGPADFAKIYNIPASLDGTGVTIGIVGDSNVDPNDVIAFRNLYGVLPATGPTIIVDGPDPGIGGPNSDEGEADLDLQVSGMVAPKATIDFVVAESTFTASGTDLAAFRIIDYNLTDVISESFGICELALGSGGTAFYSSVWEEAAAQGITVMVAAGDNGSAGCDDFSQQADAANGLSVSGIASTPFNVAVGGTDFDDVGTQTSGGFWSASNGTGKESAQGYIHETTWNDSCAAAAVSSNLNTVCSTPNNIVAGSGGPSIANPKPTWQNGITPADNARDVPDVSLFASDGPASNSFYLFCEADAIQPGSATSCASSGSFSFEGAGGTSAASPAFAGIMALINQKMGGRQGNANPVLYKLAQTAANSCNSTTQAVSPPSATCVFYDVTKGNNSVPCVGDPTNTSNCSSKTANVDGVLVDPNNLTTPAWTTKAGYDYATGLGSVNVTNLATAWQTAVGNFKGSTTALKLNGGTGTVTITHGAKVTATATVASTTTGAPSGDVSLLGPKGTINSGINSGTLSGGSPDTATLDTTFLPGGSYSVTAHYAGDGTFGPSDSNAIPVVVNKENSRLQMGVITIDPSTGNPVIINATSYVYGTLTSLRFDILNSSAGLCQPFVNGGDTSGCAFDAQGSVSVTDNGTPLVGGPFNINSEGSAEDETLQLTGGSHTLSATYLGDANYKATTTPVTNAITVSKAATAASLAPSVSTVAANASVTLTATIITQSLSSVGTTGTVTFFSGGTQIGSPVAVVPSGVTSVAFAGGTAALTTTFTSTGAKTITATYNGDTNYSSSSATGITVTVTSSGSFTVGGSALTVTAGSTGTSTITVTPTGGFTGNVNVTCPTLPPGVTCTPNPLPINVTGAAAVTGQLTVTVAAPAAQNATASVMPAERVLYAAGMAPTWRGQGWWTLSGITGLASVILLLLPGRKRLRAALGLSLMCMLCFTLGCGGYSAPGGGGGTTPTATTTHLTVTSVTKGPAGTIFTFTAAVTGGSPTDQVQLLDNGVATGSPVTVAAGTATLTTAALTTVGTHAITAHYVGDATYTSASSSGALNVTVTGATTVAIQASPASSNASPTINLTIN